ncbi:type IV pilin protein [Gemmatimonadota bacterium]
MQNRRGMTLIELLLVVTIIGLLAMISMPRLKHMKDRALIANMKHDLRTFAMHQESHYYDRASYTDDMAALTAGGYSPSANVTISVNEATILGWSATADHTESLVECYLFVGDASPIGAATVEGNLECS